MGLEPLIFFKESAVLVTRWLALWKCHAGTLIVCFAQFSSSEEILIVASISCSGSFGLPRGALNGARKASVRSCVFVLCKNICAVLRGGVAVLY